MRVFRSPGRVLAVLSVVLSLASPATAQEWPNKPIRMLVPSAPGGGTDILARMFAQRFTEAFRMQVVVDNRATASGMLAGELTAKAQPDGYTMMLVYHQHTVNAALNPKLPYHPVTSFTPISQVTSAGLMLVINMASPPKNLKEFVDWTKTYKGALNFGSAGNGSGGHLAGELYKLQTGVKAEHIPYKGSAPTLVELMGGQVQFTFAGMQSVAGLMRAGKIRGIAVTSPKRVASVPDIPAMNEVVPGFEVVGWFGILAPAGLPKPILAKLHGEIVKALQVPEVRDRILNDGAEPVGSSPEEFRQFLIADMAKWIKLVKESGAKFE